MEIDLGSLLRTDSTEPLQGCQSLCGERGVLVDLSTFWLHESCHEYCWMVFVSVCHQALSEQSSSTLGRLRRLFAEGKAEWYMFYVLHSVASF